MQIDETALKATPAVNLGTIPTVVILALATLGAGTAGAKAGLAVSTFIKQRKTKTAVDQTQTTTK